MRSPTALNNNVTSMQVTDNVNNMLDHISALQNGKPKSRIVEEMVLLLATLHNNFQQRTPDNDVIDDLHQLFVDASKLVAPQEKDQRMVTIALRKIHSNKIRATRLMYNLSNSQVFEVLIPYYMNVRVFHGDEIGLYKTVGDLTMFDSAQIDNMNLLLNRWTQLAVVTHMERILVELDVDPEWHGPMLDAARQIGVDQDAPRSNITITQGADYDFS